MKTKKTMMQSTTIKIRYPMDFMFARLSKWDVRFLVASPRVQDLLLSAKDLFVAASRVRSAMGLPWCEMHRRGHRCRCGLAEHSFLRSRTPSAVLVGNGVHDGQCCLRVLHIDVTTNVIHRKVNDLCA